MRANGEGENPLRTPPWPGGMHRDQAAWRRLSHSRASALLPYPSKICGGGPPSTTIVSPVIQDEASEARKTHG